MHDVAGEHPDQVTAMRAFYDAWWAELEPTFSQTTEIYLGHPEHPVVTLTGHDWIQGPLPPWNQAHIRGAQANRSGQGGSDRFANAEHKGHWAVKVITDGTYEISLRRWPAESDAPIRASLPAKPNVPGASKAFRANPGMAIPVTRATLRLDGDDVATKPVGDADTQVTFTARLARGSHQLAPVFHVSGGEIGAYYTTVTRVN